MCSGAATGGSEPEPDPATPYPLISGPRSVTDAVVPISLFCLILGVTAGVESSGYRNREQEAVFPPSKIKPVPADLVSQSLWAGRNLLASRLSAGHGFDKNMRLAALADLSVDSPTTAGRRRWHQPVRSAVVAAVGFACSCGDMSTTQRPRSHRALREARDNANTYGAPCRAIER